MHADGCNLLRDEGCLLAVPPHAGFDKDTALKRAASHAEFREGIITQVRAHPGHSARTWTWSPLLIPIASSPTFSQYRNWICLPCFECGRTTPTSSWPQKKVCSTIHILSLAKLSRTSLNMMFLTVLIGLRLHCCCMHSLRCTQWQHLGVEQYPPYLAQHCEEC